MNNNETAHSGWIDKNLTAYKIAISIIFGLLGFAVNFYPVDFVFYGSYRMSFLFGLLFPMLITLSWGWKYGLLSALCGGCQTMWILWFPQSGYGPLVSVPPFTLWIVWLGWFSRTRHNIYIGEIIFRIFNTVLLYTVFRWVFTFNVPPHNVGIPLTVVHSIVFKELVNGLLILFITQALLHSGKVRTFFKLPKSTEDPRLYYTYTNSVILGGILIFGFVGEGYIWGMWGPEFQNVARIIGSLLLLLIGITCTYFTANAFAKKKTEELILAGEALRESEEKLLQTVQGNSIATFVIDKEHFITHWNRACENLTGVSANQMVGTKKQWSVFYSKERPVMADLILGKLSEEEIAGYYDGKIHKSTFTEGAYNEEAFSPDLGKNGKWLFSTAAPLKDRRGEVIGAIETLQDITERKLAEEALRESEEKYRSIFENAVEGFFQSTPEGRFISVNPAFAGMLGYASPEELISNISDIAEQYYVNHEDRLRYKQLLQKDGSVEHFEFRVRCKDGSQIWVSNSTRAIYDRDGKIARYEGNVNNITERKQAEEALRESEEKHRLLAENTVDCIWQMNLDMEFTYINQAIFSFLEYTPKEWIGSKLPEHCSSEEIEKMQAIILDGLANLPDKTTEVFETTFYHKNGEEIPCEVSGKIVLDDAGNPIYLQGTTRNITERKRAEKMLKESNDLQRYLHSMTRLMCDNLPDLIWTKDLENKYIFANKACCEKLLNAKDTDEPVGKTDMYFATREKESHPENPEYHTFGETCTESDLAVLETKKSLRFEEFGNLKEKFIYLDVYKAPFYDEKGNPIGTVGCAKDITREKEIEEEQKKAEEEKKKLEAQLVHAQKMEAIGTLTGGIAHDFNNLLTAIIGNAEIALMDVIKDESLRRGIEEIKKAGNKAASLTRQLLAFSRKQVIKPEILDLNEVINETEKMLKRMIGEDIEFQTVLEPELWKVYMDSGQIDQMIINMVVNSRDAMPHGGKLVVETANVDLDENYLREHGIEETPGSYVMLAISDTGSGMDKETQEHLFEPFFTTKEIGKGTGLGLSTVYGIVKQNTGFIWVYSEPGHGTTFKVYLPKVKEGVEPEEKEQTPVGDLNGSETVLIVEDDDRLRNLTRKILERYGYSVQKAENGEDALRVSEEHEGSIHLMITDVVMPKMSGRETAERLQPLYPKMKVIYMSGYTDNAIVHHGVLVPGINFLEKPFTPEGLARKVREVLDDLN